MEKKFVLRFWVFIFMLWSSSSVAMERDEAYKIQALLMGNGYLSGNIDGLIGKNTLKAASKAQDNLGVELNTENPAPFIKALEKAFFKQKKFNRFDNFVQNFRAKSRVAPLQASSVNIKLSERLHKPYFSGNSLKTISSSALQTNGKKVRVIHNTKIEVDKDATISGNSVLIIVDSQFFSKSIVQNEFAITVKDNASLIVLNSYAPREQKKEAFLFEFKDNANSFHYNFNHRAKDPWMTTLGHRGQLRLVNSTCNVTLGRFSSSKIRCVNAPLARFEPLLPKGNYQLSIPTDSIQKDWTMDGSLPWDINIKNSYFKRVGWGLTPGVNLTVYNTKNLTGGWTVCCRGEGVLEDIKKGKIYKNRTWSLKTDKGTMSLTMKNSSFAGIWPGAWGSYTLTLRDIDVLATPGAKDNSTLNVINSTFQKVQAFDNSSVTISGSKSNMQVRQTKSIQARNRAKIYLENMPNFNKAEIASKGQSKVFIDGKLIE